MPSIAATIIDDIGDYDPQPNAKRRRLSNTVLRDPAGPSSVTASRLDAVTHTVGMHMTDASSGSASKYDPELDLNLKTIEENYEELCRLLV